jgi:hypothetical protein
MNETLWEEVSFLKTRDLTTSGGGGGDNGGDPAKQPRCSHCHNQPFHKLVNQPGSKAYCPFKSMSDSKKAQEAAVWVLEQKKGDPSKDLAMLLMVAMSQFG